MEWQMLEFNYVLIKYFENVLRILDAIAQPTTATS